MLFTTESFRVRRGWRLNIAAASAVVCVCLVVVPGGSARLSAVPTTQRQDADVAGAIKTVVVGNPQLTALYAGEAFAPLWVDTASRPTRDARDTLALLAGAARDGLDPDDYRADALERSAAALGATPAPQAAAVAAFDTGLSAGLLLYLRQVHMGRVDPRVIGFRMTAPADEHDFAALVRSALAAHRITETAAGLAPPLALYRGLRGMLARYRSLAADPTLEAVPPSAASVHPGERYAGLRALHRLLLALDDVPADVPAPAELSAYDGALVEGVKRFQIRHGLQADGVIGKGTQAALRVPLSLRVRQIELALERLRWLPHIGDERLLLVNIPMFQLWGWDSIPPIEAPTFGMGVIVGRALNTQTPVFAEEMRYLIFRPYWNVPSSILRKEILPTLARDPDYLRRQDMEIVSGPGDDARAVAMSEESMAGLRRGTLRLRQRPGPKNSLGLVKFVFPNDHDVYMHGTPAPQLFGRARRDFSHGCVRVEDPVALAQWALQDQPQWTRDRILDAMHATGSQRVSLTRPIQVILFYVTAVVMPEDGTIRFAEDIYGHDAKLDRALAKRQPSQ